MATNAELVDYIRQAAVKRGIDPDYALRVARGEGGLSNPFRHGEGPAPKSQDPSLGPLENSIGPFQLYVSGTGAGLGDRAVAAGIDPTKNWQGGVDFALDEARRKGWDQWYGAKAQGITGMMGINGAPVGQQPGEASVADYRAGTSGDKPVYVASLPETPAQPDAQPAAAPAVAAATTPAVGGKSPLRQKLAKAASGFKAPAVASTPVDMAGLRPMPAARVDTPEIAPFDQNQIASQRQNLAMALQRLNSGKLWL
jgi:hypothetical protein